MPIAMGELCLDFVGPHFCRMSAHHLDGAGVEPVGPPGSHVRDGAGEFGVFEVRARMSAPHRSAPRRSASSRSAPSRFASRRMAFTNLAFVALACRRSVLHRSVPSNVAETSQERARLAWRI